MLRFKKGDHILYGISGVCLIEDIRRDALSKQRDGEYYVLRPAGERGSTILVPTDSETLTARMAPLHTRDEADRLIDAARQEVLPWIDARKERTAGFQRLVKRCDLGELLCLVSCICRKRQELTAAGRRLPAADENILRRAESLIENELSFVLELEPAQAGEYVREKLGIEP